MIDSYIGPVVVWAGPDARSPVKDPSAELSQALRWGFNISATFTRVLIDSDYKSNMDINSYLISRL